MHRHGRIMPIYFCSSALRSMLFVFALSGLGASGYAADEPWKELQEQNRVLRAQLDAQQRQLDDLRAQMDRMANSRETISSNQPSASEVSSGSASERKLVISGEIGLAFFSQGRDGLYRNDEFRVDDANLRFEASIAPNAYFYGELWVARHESSFDETFHLGEFYLEYENLSGVFGLPERLINVRFGRVNIPFGEEYQHRTPLSDPLITHSISDVWGIDEGIEFYGESGHASYAFAVQNGSSKTFRDYNADKAVTLRLGYDVTSKLHLSASGMRTGKLASAQEPSSEVWLANSVFRNIGSSTSTTHQAELAQIDAGYTWSKGHIAAAAGRARYRDNDQLADNTRHFDYYQIEGVQSLTTELYGAIRFSSLRVDHGYPMVGLGNYNKYFLGTLQTKELNRLSFGGGYRFNRSLILKADYTLEEGELTTGVSRDNHMLSFESAIGF